MTKRTPEKSKKEELQSNIKLAMSGDVDAYIYLYDKFESYVFNIAFNMLNHEEDAHDVVQEVFVKVLKKIATLEHIEAFSEWLEKITVNHCINILRSSNNRVIESPKNQFEIDAHMNEMTSPIELYETKETHQIIRKFVNSLPSDQREAMVLRYYQGLSVKEIAAYQECPVSTVTSKLSYGNKKLKKYILEYEKKTKTKLYSFGMASAVASALADIPCMMPFALSMNIFLTIMDTLGIDVPMAKAKFIKAKNAQKVSDSPKGKFINLANSHYIIKVSVSFIMMLCFMCITGTIVYIVTLRDSSTAKDTFSSSIADFVSETSDVEIINDNDILLISNTESPITEITVSTMEELYDAVMYEYDIININGSIEIEKVIKLFRRTVIKGGELYRSDDYDGNIIFIGGNGNIETPVEIVIEGTTIDGKCYDKSTNTYIRECDSLINVTGGASLVLDGAKIINNYNNEKTSEGGAILCNGESTLTVKGESVIRNNQSYKYGGAVYMYPDSVLTIESGATIDNNQSEYGGAIYALSCQIYITGGTFSYNIASNRGGAICIYDGNIQIEDGLFLHNTAQGFGGAIYVDNGEFMFHGGTAKNNRSYDDGGFLALRNTSKGVLYGGDISYNTCKHSGGAIYISHSELSIEGGEYLGNEGELSGGVIRMSTNSTCIVNDGEFTYNVGEAHGGGVFDVNTATLIINGGIYKNNSTDGHGGIIRSTYSEITINDGEFTKNISEFGSVVIQAHYDLSEYVPDKYFLNINGGTFTRNHSDNSTIVVVNAVLSMNGGEVYENTAKGTCAGIYVYRTGILNLYNGVVRDNTTPSGISNVKRESGASTDKAIINDFIS